MNDTRAGRAEVDLSLACDESAQDRQDWRDLLVLELPVVARPALAYNRRR